MPELPEVQALATDLTRRLAGRTIARLEVVSINALRTVEPPVSALAGQTIEHVERHGKFLDIVAGDVRLVMHLSLAGWVRWHDGGGTAPPPAHPGKGPLVARLLLDDGARLDVTEYGTRHAVALYVVRRPEEVPGITRLGPDPLAQDFTRDTLAQILGHAGRSRIKGVLRDQARVAGIGNAYSDEILHAARLSPFKPASSFDDTEVDQLFEAVRAVLSDAVARADGMGAADLKREKKLAMQVHGHTGQPCPVCGDTVLQVVYSDSTMQYCPTCQTGGRPLADRALSRLLK